MNIQQILQSAHREPTRTFVTGEIIHREGEYWIREYRRFNGHGETVGQPAYSVEHTNEYGSLELELPNGETRTENYITALQTAVAGCEGLV